MIRALSPVNLLASAHATATYIGETLHVPLTLVLWDRSRIELGENSAATITITSANVIASLLKNPTLDNMIKHYTAGSVLLDGELMVVGQLLRSHVKKKDIKRISKKYLFSKMWPFLFVAAHKPVAQHSFDNDAQGSQHKNESNTSYIQFHYDVSNAFYQLFLDPQMQYSCGYFKEWDNSLEQAQIDKLEMICRKLRLKKDEKLLDIGCGWGGLICYAAQHYGVYAHGITLSQEQYAFTLDKIKQLGLEDKVTVEIHDYLTLEGLYDKISSIGMFEHIGLKNFPAYFRKINSLLREGGILLNHGIARRSKANSHTTLTKITPEKRMILKYIFPGSELAPIGHTLNNLEAYGFEVHDVEAWREHYALTCQHWCQRLESNKQEAISLVGIERYRLWVAYLAGVSFGFTAGSILIFQAVASKRSKAKKASQLPPTRADLYSS